MISSAALQLFNTCILIVYASLKLLTNIHNYFDTFGLERVLVFFQVSTETEFLGTCAPDFQEVRGSFKPCM